MAEANVLLFSFNHGVISKLALARTDIKRTALSAEIQKNWIPRTLGSMMLRPGLKYIGATDSNNKAFYIPFVYAHDDTALLEFTDSTLRIWDSDALVTRASITSTITNGGFTSDLTGWTDSSSGSGSSSWETGGYLNLTGDGDNPGQVYQQVTVTGGNLNTEHALRLIVTQGTVTIRVGSSNGDDDYVTESDLGEGYHSLAFTPSGDFYIQLTSYSKFKVLVDSCTLESSGTLSLPTPYAEADLSLLRHDASADVTYLACEGYEWRKIERRDNNSWSIVKYQPEDGPFRVINITPVTITPSATSGDITLTASAPLFASTHVGGLFRLTMQSQLQSSDIASENTFTSSILVSEESTGGKRQFSIILTGTWTGTITLQYSVGIEGNWVTYDTYTANQSITVNDGLDNQIIYYRLGFETGNYGSGTATCKLSYSSGAQTGVVRITDYTSSTVVTGACISDLGSTDATDDWYESDFSDYRGWPSAVKLFQGRLWWFGKNWIVASVSDSYESHDDTTIGDSSPINRTIGFGPVDTINWAHDMDRIMFGTASAVLQGRSNALDEPLTVSNFNITRPLTKGSCKVAGIKVDGKILYIQQSKTNMVEISYDAQSYQYSGRDVSIHVPEVLQPEIIKIVHQTIPENRVHCVRSDGTVALLIYDDAENILCWVTVETDGDIEDVVVLPGDIEDAVYYVVNRTINGSTVRYLEKWALEQDCLKATSIYNSTSTTSITDLPYPDNRVVTVYDSAGTKVENLTVSGGAITLSTASTYAWIIPSTHLLADSFITYSGVSTTAMTGLDHLEGETVVVRGDGQDLGTYTVSSGAITLSTAVEEAVIGLSYDAKFKSTKLAYAAQLGSSIGVRKSIHGLGIVLNDTYYKGITFGPDFDNLSNMPSVFLGNDVDTKYIYDQYDNDMQPFLKKHGIDARLCLKAAAPNPCVVLATVIGITTHG